MKLKIFMFMCLVGISKADYCQNNFTLAELPGGILEEALSILIHGTIDNFLGCQGNHTVSPNKVNFWFYNRSNPDIPILLDLNNPYQVDPAKKTIFIIPGWLCNVTNDRMPELRAAYLQRYDCNVIGIDWTAYSIDLYTESFCYIPGVAEVAGALICKLSTLLNVNLDDVHILGHSMGGQTAGFIGQEVQKQCNSTIGRITGMDPAGPLYETLPISRRLDETDAKFVDVIHTNGGSLGMLRSCGHADFFVNCGTFQPGCMEIDDSTSIEEIINLPTATVGCNHLRSIDYTVESVNPGTKTFEATSCSGCPTICLIDILFPKHNEMGEYCTKPSKSTKYYLKTNSDPPFARG